MRGSFIAKKNVFKENERKMQKKITDRKVFQVEQLQAFKVQLHTKFQLLNGPDLSANFTTCIHISYQLSGIPYWVMH